MGRHMMTIVGSDRCCQNKFTFQSAAALLAITLALVVPLHSVIAADSVAAMDGAADGSASGTATMMAAAGNESDAQPTPSTFNRMEGVDEGLTEWYTMLSTEFYNAMVSLPGSDLPETWDPPVLETVVAQLRKAAVIPISAESTATDGFYVRTYAGYPIDGGDKFLLLNNGRTIYFGDWTRWKKAHEFETAFVEWCQQEVYFINSKLDYHMMSKVLPSQERAQLLELKKKLLENPPRTHDECDAFESMRMDARRQIEYAHYLCDVDGAIDARNAAVAAAVAKAGSDPDAAAAAAIAADMAAALSSRGSGDEFGDTGANDNSGGDNHDGGGDGGDDGEGGYADEGGGLDRFPHGKTKSRSFKRRMARTAVFNIRNAVVGGSNRLVGYLIDGSFGDILSVGYIVFDAEDKGGYIGPPDDAHVLHRDKSSRMADYESRVLNETADVQGMHTWRKAKHDGTVYVAELLASTGPGAAAVLVDDPRRHNVNGSNGNGDSNGNGNGNGNGRAGAGSGDDAVIESERSDAMQVALFDVINHGLAPPCTLIYGGASSDDSIGANGVHGGSGVGGGSGSGSVKEAVRMSDTWIVVESGNERECVLYRMYTAIDAVAAHNSATEQSTVTQSAAPSAAAAARLSAVGGVTIEALDDTSDPVPWNDPKHVKRSEQLAIVTASHHEDLGLFSPTLRNHMCMCEQHSAACYHTKVKASLLSGRSVFHIKIPSLQAALFAHRFAMWLDADAFFNLPAVANESPLDYFPVSGSGAIRDNSGGNGSVDSKNDKDNNGSDDSTGDWTRRTNRTASVVLTGYRDYVNTGVMLFADEPPARALLQAVWDESVVNFKMHPGDQTAMEHVLLATAGKEGKINYDNECLCSGERRASEARAMCFGLPYGYGCFKLLSELNNVTDWSQPPWDGQQLDGIHITHGNSIWFEDTGIGCHLDKNSRHPRCLMDDYAPAFAIHTGSIFYQRRRSEILSTLDACKAS